VGWLTASPAPHGVGAWLRTRRLDRPVLIVQGHQDPIGDLTAEHISAAISGAVVEYVNKAGHFPWLEQPEPVQTLVRDFLAAPASR
jgi:proline iminopeptidase